MKFRSILALTAAAAGLCAVYRIRKSEPRTPVTPEQELEGRMREFIQEDRFTLLIQPVVELSTGRIAGGEVLARLDHPERGLLRPDAFLPVVSRMDLQADFDLYIFRKSCQWLSGVQGPVSISVNFNRKTLSQPRIAQQLIDIADEYRLNHGNVVIEVTELEKEDNIDLYRANLRQLRENGFRVFLDDFGSGVTSIADLNQCALDIVKIDRSVLLAAESPDGSIILNALTDMASTLGVDVVCEGIETEEQEALARACGCRYGQGLRYSGPISSDSFLELLRQGTCV